MIALGDAGRSSSHALKVRKSRRVVPGRLLQQGFSFEFPSWPEAARDLCGRWRNAAR